MLGSYRGETAPLVGNSALSLTSDIDPALSRWTKTLTPPAPDGSLSRSLDQGQLVVLVERRRRRQRPFERRRARAPRIVRRLHLAHERVGDAEEEHQRAKPGKIGPERGNQVPAGERIGVIGDAPRHAGEPEEVLREEHDVDADKREPEMQLTDRLGGH